MASTLELILLYLAAAIAGVVGFRMLRLPPVLGYLVAGVIIGPNALQLAHDTAGVRSLAEFGVVFLMFVIGLEFNLPKLRAMRTLVFGLGASQVVADHPRRDGRQPRAGVGLRAARTPLGSDAGRPPRCWAARWRCPARRWSSS